jgi:hypothetical protein
MRVSFINHSLLDHPAILPIALAFFAAPKRIGLKSYMWLSAVLVKSSLITSSDVSTHLRPNWKSGLDLR